MFSNFSKIIITLFLCFAALQLFILLSASPVMAAPMPTWTMPEPKLQIPIDTIKFTAPEKCGGTDEQPVYCVKWIGQYVIGLYKYAIGVVGILAAVVLMVGGIIWLTAGGSAGRIGEAKSWIGSALAGLVIALTSYLILYQINPNLVSFKPIQVQMAKVVTTPTPAADTGIGCCAETDPAGRELSCSNITSTECRDKYIAPDSMGASITYIWHSNKECKGNTCAEKQIIIGASLACASMRTDNNTIDYSKITGSTPLPSSCSKYDFSSYGIYENVLKAIAAKESSCNQNAQSPHACGLMQLKPETAGISCSDLKADPQKSIKLAYNYITSNISKHEGDLYKILAGYNSGYALGIDPITGKKGGLAPSTDCPGFKAYECCINPGGLTETQDYVFMAIKYLNGL